MTRTRALFVLATSAETIPFTLAPAVLVVFTASALWEVRDQFAATHAIIAAVIATALPYFTDFVRRLTHSGFLLLIAVLALALLARATGLIQPDAATRVVFAAIATGMTLGLVHFLIVRRAHWLRVVHGVAASRGNDQLAQAITVLLPSDPPEPEQQVD